MSTDRLIPAEVDLVPQTTVLDEELGSIDSRLPRAPRLTPEERGMRTKVVAEHVARLEQIPTADLSTAALRRLTLFAIEISSVDPLGGEQLQVLGSGNDPGAEPSKTSTPGRRKSDRVEVATNAVQRGKPPRH